MDTFNKLTGLLLRALETREPTVDLLSSFIDHWRSITNYYIETTDDSRPVGQTDIPWHLRQMLDILVYEEKQQTVEDTGPGPCLEYLLQHKLLETLCTLGKAQYPPGMCQQVLLFFYKFLSQMEKPLLQLVNVYRPVQKLIRLCALPGSNTQKEEAQFLLAVCSRVKQEPHVLRYILEPLDQPLPSSQSQCSMQASNHSTDPESSSPVQSESSQSGPESSEPGPVQSESSHSGPESSRSSPVQSGSSRSDPSQSESSWSDPVQSETGLLWALLQLTRSQRGAVRLKVCEGLLLLSGLSGLSSAQTQLGMLLAGRLQELYLLLPEEDATALYSWSPQNWRAGLRSESLDHMTNFFSWWDFLDQLTRDAPQELSLHVSQCVHQVFLVETLHPQLLHTCEQVVLVSTSILCAAVRLVQSRSLLDQLVHFLLRSSLTELLLQRCDHISDQISMVSLSLVDELLQKPQRDILDILVLSFLDSRSYLCPSAEGQEDGPLQTSDESNDSEDLEEDPFFSHSTAPPPATAAGSAADVVSSFLCLVPLQVRSAQLLQEGGCEFYVHDAHTLVTQCQALSLSWDWPQTLPVAASSSSEEVFFEGHLLKILLDRLGRILEQPYELNLQLTAILSRLSSFSHPLLDEYLLNPYTYLRDGTRSMFSVLVRVVGELMHRIQQVPQLSDRLLDARRHLLGLKDSTGLEHLTLLRGIIVLEEFCKELAAIAFVKLPLEPDSPGLGSPGLGLSWTRTDSTNLTHLDHD